jgi:hypothetical protein
LNFFPLPQGHGWFLPVFPAGCCIAVRGSLAVAAGSAQAEMRGTRRSARCRAFPACCRSSLASSGRPVFSQMSYIAGDRRVSRTERTKWRVTFRRLATEAQSALHDTDSGPAEKAMELMIDLARHAQGCFRSEDPLEAAKFVVSQAVSALWETVLDARGFAEFTARAVPQLMRWEREHGWAEGTGACKVREQERPLAEVLVPMLTTPDMWVGFADAYLAELDRIAAADAPPAVKKNTRAWRDWAGSSWRRDQAKRDRAGRFARWNLLLIEHLDEERARRLAEHAAFGGPEADFLKAQAARRRGDLEEARALITECLKQRRWDTEFKGFAEEVGADVPDLS